MSMSKWMERENAIVNSIMSGDNACGTLQKAVTAGGETLANYLRATIQPTLQVCAEEEAQKDRDLSALSRDNEAKRFALESVASNVPNLPVPVVTLMEQALPGRKI